MDGTQIIIPYWVILLNIGISLLCGLVPLILGFRKGKTKLGIIGFIVCLVIGVILGLLGTIPAAGIFAYFISRKKTAVATSEENPFAK